MKNGWLTPEDIMKSVFDKKDGTKGAAAGKPAASPASGVKGTYLPTAGKVTVKYADGPAMGVKGMYLPTAGQVGTGGGGRPQVAPTGTEDGGASGRLRPTGPETGGRRAGLEPAPTAAATVSTGADPIRRMAQDSLQKGVRYLETAREAAGGGEALPTATATTGRSSIYSGDPERDVRVLSVGLNGIADRRKPLEESLAALRREINQSQYLSTPEKQQEQRQRVQGILKRLSELDEWAVEVKGNYDSALSEDERRATWVYLAGLQRPLTDTEKELAKEGAAALKTKPMEAVTAQLGMDQEAMRRQNENRALASILLSKSSATGSFGAGLVESFPGARNALQAGQDYMRDSGAYRQLYKDPELASVMEGKSTLENARAGDPGAYAAGGGVGDLTQMMGLSKLFKAGVGGIKVLSKLPTALQSALGSGLTFGTKGALDEASDGGSPVDIAKAGGIGFAGGAVGGLASEAVGAAGGAIMKSTGLQNSIPAAILRDGISGAAFAGGSMGTNMLLNPEYRPTGVEAGKDLAVAFAFSTLGSVLNTMGRTKADKARIRQYGEDIKRDYATIVNGAGGKMTLEALDDLAAKSLQVRAELANNTYLGQQKTVGGILDFLNVLDDSVAGARAGIYNSGLSGGSTPGGERSMTLGGVAGNLPVVSGQAMLPTAAELSPGTLGGMAANSQALANLPTAAVDSGGPGPYDGGKRTPAAIMQDYFTEMEATPYGGEEAVGERQVPTVPGGVPGVDVRREDNRGPGAEGLDPRGAENYPGAPSAGRGRGEEPPQLRRWTTQELEASAVSTPSPAASRASSILKDYGVDSLSVDSEEMSLRGGGTHAFTRDGKVYLSDTIPENKIELVAHHEAVHAIKQRGLEEYRTLLERANDALDFGKPQARQVVGALVQARFPGRDFIELSPSETKTVLDELNAVLWGYQSTSTERARQLFSSVFSDYDGYLARFSAVMEGAKGGGQYLPRAGETQGEGFLDRASEEGDPFSYIDRKIPPDEVQRGIQNVAWLLPVAKTTGEEFGKGAVDLITQVSSFFQSVGGQVENPQLGTVRLDRSGVGDDIAHGIGRKKAAAFAAVPAVLERGEVIDYQTDWKGRGYDTAVVAAPVTISGEEYLEGIVLIRRNQTNRFYVHEVLMAKNNEAVPFKTGDSPKGEGLPGGAAPSVISLLRQVADVKRGLSGAGDDGFFDMRQPEGSAEEGLDAGRWDRILGEDAPPAPESARERQAVDEIVKALDEWGEAAFGAKTADVMTEMPKGTAATLGETLRNGGHDAYRKFVDSGEAVGRMGKELGDKSLYAYYNFARASSNAAGNMLSKGGAQTDVMGREVGPSLPDLFEPIRAKGDDYYRDFETYLFHRHNVDRMSRDNSVAIEQAKFELDDFDERNPDVARMTEGDLEKEAKLGDYAARERMNLLNAYNRAKGIVNKPVFGPETSAMDSIGEAARLERAHPEFEELAEGVYRYNKNLMQYRVDSGLLTQEQAERIEKAYPHYVPTYRLTAGELARAQKRGQSVSKTLGRAQGGTSDLMPLHVAMARQTMQVVRNGSANRFGGRLLEDYGKNRKAGGKYIYEVGEAQYEAHPDYFDLLDDPTPKKENTFTVYQDGKAVQMTVDKALYEGISALTPGKSSVMDADFWKPVQAANSLFKALVTGYNPMFSARNFARDLQEAGLYSKDLGAWVKNYPLAVKEIAANGEWWKRYQALGGVYSSVFDYQQGYKLGEKEHGAVRRNTLGRVEGLNMAIEQAPRLAEFMAQAKKNAAGAERDISFDSYMDAMLAAANVTTNFGRSGTVGKFLNRTFVPFLNPSIQGIDKGAKAFLGKKSGKDWLKLIARLAALGIAPALINALVNKDEPGWDTVRQSDKDVNWLISLGDGRYIKIPKGRDMSVAVMLAGRVGDMARGEDVDWGGTLRTAANQVAPPNPLENNVMAAWMDADLLDSGSPGKTWYGGNIENQRLQGYEPGQRYDENTDALSKAIGGALGISPKKLNYILDQYSGVVGDFVLPMITPSGDKNPLSPFSRAFVLDSVNSNRLSTDFYAKTDELAYAKNGGDGAAAILQRFWNKQAGAVSDVYAQIREKESGGTLPNADMLEQVRQDKSVINGIQQNALDVLPAYEAAARKFYTGDSDKEKDEAYRKANREVFGAEYALQVYNKDVYERAVECHGQGVSYEDYYDVYFAMRDKETTNEKRDVLNKTDLTDEEKIVLYRDRISKDRDDDIEAVRETELGFNDFLRAQNEYNTLSKQKGGAADKATEFARWMNGQDYSEEQYGAVREAFRFYSQIPNNETVYERFVGVGVGDGTAYDLSVKLSGLTPELGKNQVSSLQKSRVIVDSGMDDSGKVAALGEVMSESDYLKLSTAYQYSVPPDAYVSYRERLAQVDTNGTVTQAEAQQAIDGLDLTREQKAALWQLQNTSWKAYRNPYSQSVGGQVLELYQSEKGKGETIQTRYGDGTGGSSTVQVQTRYGSGTGAASGSGQVWGRYGSGESTPPIGGGVVGRYGSRDTYLPTAGQALQGGGIVTRYK